MLRLERRRQAGMQACKFQEYVRSSFIKSPTDSLTDRRRQTRQKDETGREGMEGNGRCIARFQGIVSLYISESKANRRLTVCLLALPTYSPISIGLQSAAWNLIMSWSFCSTFANKIACLRSYIDSVWIASTSSIALKRSKVSGRAELPTYSGDWT